jgi:hypothetical protein
MVMKTFAILLAIAVLAVTTLAENFSGHWMVETPGRGGQVQQMILALNQNGGVVTGTLSARLDAGTASPVNNQIWGGKADGNTITFYVWRGSDKPWKQTYAGTINGDQITFTITDAPHATNNFAPPARGGTAQNASVQVTAKRTD